MTTNGKSSAKDLTDTFRTELFTSNLFQRTEPNVSNSTQFGTMIENCVKIPHHVVHLAKLINLLIFELSLYYDQYKKQLMDCIFNKDVICFFKLITSSYGSAERFGIIDTLSDVAVDLYILLKYVESCFLG
ncbi:hypothetical protein M8J76_016363 [Diaphorina citri]|nr:hypothetical protein M8J76_016363 [Diaphorina citri]